MDHESELLKGNTPTLILAALRDGPLHGYGIARQIEQRSRGALQCKEGTLYPALHAMERDALIEGDWQTLPNGRKRKVYRITPRGLAEMERRRITWERFASAVKDVLRGDGDERGDKPEPVVPGPGGFPGIQPAGA